MTAKRHHYVPRFLLERFTGAGDGLWQLDKKNGRSQRTAPTNAAVIRYYYTFEDETGQPSTEAEEAFARLEHLAAGVIKNLSEPGCLLSEEDRGTLAVFVALMHLRTPLGRQWLKDMAENFAKGHLRSQALFLPAFNQMVDRFERDTGQRRTVVERENLRRAILDLDRHVRIEAPPQMTLKMMWGLAGGYARDIYNLHWVVARAPDTRFILSDTPLAMFDPTPAFPHGGNGIRSSVNAETTLPLDPGTCLVMTPEPAGATAEAVAQAWYVREINLRTYAWAQRWIYGPSQDAVTKVRAEARKDRARMGQLAPRPPAGIFATEWPEGGEQRRDERYWSVSATARVPRDRKVQSGSR